MIDIYSLNDDGNLLDAAGIGAIAALKTARIPEYDEESGRAKFGELSNERIPLMKELPISLTAHKIGEHFIMDPNAEEEAISEARVTVSSSDGIIHAMQKGEAKEMEIEQFYSVLDLIEKTEREIFKKLEKHLK